MSDEKNAKSSGWDKVKETAGKLWGKTKETAGKGLDWTKKQAEITSLNLKINTSESDIKKSIEKLGNLAYKTFTDDENASLSASHEEVVAILNDIKKSQEEIEGYKQQIENIKNEKK